MPLTKNEYSRLDEDGYLALEGIVDPRHVTRMRTRLEILLAGTPQDHAGTLIVSGLLRDDVFDAAWNHPRVLEKITSPNGRAAGIAKTIRDPAAQVEELFLWTLSRRPTDEERTACLAAT